MKTRMMHELPACIVLLLLYCIVTQLKASPTKSLHLHLIFPFPLSLQVPACYLRDLSRIYYNCGLIFVALSIIPTGNNSTEFTKVIAKIGKHDSLAKKQSDGARIPSSQKIVQAYTSCHKPVFV